MSPEKRKRLRDAGWQVGAARDFLDLSEEEVVLVELKLALTDALKASRAKRGLSQVELAHRMGSSQSRIAKIEAGDRSVSLDLIIRALLAAGATRQDLKKALTSHYPAAA